MCTRDPGCYEALGSSLSHGTNRLQMPVNSRYFWDGGAKPMLRPHHEIGGLGLPHEPLEPGSSARFRPAWEERMIEWNLQSRAHACQECGHGFQDKQTLYTALFDQRDGYQRVDVCESCWANRYANAVGERTDLISHWQSTYASPPAAPPDPIQKETAETLLRKLVELNDPQHGPACFILAVMLERKRLLKVKAQNVEDGRRVYIYEHSRSGDLFTIPDPDLQLDQLDIVQRDVALLLEHGLNPPASTASTDTADTARPAVVSSPAATSPEPGPATEPTLAGPKA